MDPLVLVVDDDADTRETLKVLLEHNGYRVDLACDGREALLQLRAGSRPAVILLDIAQGAFSAFTFRDEQLKNPEFAAIPVIVESGIYEVKAAAKQLGAIAYIRKPLEVDTLLTILRDHLPHDQIAA